MALDDPAAVAQLLYRLEDAEARDQMAILLARDPATHVTLDDPVAVVRLLERLHSVGAQEQLTALAEQVATHVTR